MDDLSTPAIVPTPLGYVDHSPFSGLGVELVYGRDREGRNVHISQVVGGLACNCDCPACGEPLVAKKGQIKVPHFAHASGGSGCGQGAETSAHIWAKEVLEREKYLLVPEVGAAIGDDRKTKHPPQRFSFVSAKLERSLKDIVPDVELTTRGGKTLLVEVFVTHACDAEKIAKLRERKLATIEVDLSVWRNSGDRAAIEEALLETAPRKWLYNAKVEETLDELRQEIADREAQAIAEERQARQEAQAEKSKREREAQQKLESGVDRLMTAARNRARRPETGKAEYANLVAAGKVDLLLLDLTSPGFLVPPRHWQALLIDRILIQPLREDAFNEISMPLRYFMLVLHPCIDSEFAMHVPRPVAAEFKKRAGAVHMPHEAVEVLIAHLCAEGYLERCGDGWEYSASYRQQIYRTQSERRQRDRRIGRVDRALARIMLKIPPGERVGFDADIWRVTPLAAWEAGPQEIVDGPENRWRSFSDALQAIENMVEGGAKAPDPMGLPLAGELARAQRRAEEKSLVEADDRERMLRNWATQRLLGAAGQWLENPLADGVTPIEKARADTAGFDAALSAMNEVEQARRERARIETWQTKLREAAEKALGKETAGFFLNHLDPALGARPLMHCADAHSLAECLSALKPWVSRSRGKKR